MRWHMSSRGGQDSCKLLYSVYFTILYLRRRIQYAHISAVGAGADLQFPKLTANR